MCVTINTEILTAWSICFFVSFNYLFILWFYMGFDLWQLINNIPAFVQIKARHQPGDKPLSEPMMIILLTHICITQPQWVQWHRLHITISCLIWDCFMLIFVIWDTIRLFLNTWKHPMHLDSEFIFHHPCGYKVVFFLFLQHFINCSSSINIFLIHSIQIKLFVLKQQNGMMPLKPRSV